MYSKAHILSNLLPYLILRFFYHCIFCAKFSRAKARPENFLTHPYNNVNLTTKQATIDIQNAKTNIHCTASRVAEGNLVAQSNI